MEASNVSKTGSSIDTGLPEKSPRQAVYERYQDLLNEQQASPDSIFISGHSLQELDSNLVALDEDAGEHPRSWTLKKKVWTTAYLAAFLFFSPFASTIFAPAVYLVMDGLGITNNTVGALQVSVFLFAYAVGPPFLAPLSEKYGRAIVIHGGNLVFVAFSIGGGFCKTATSFAVCRFFAGLGGSAGLAVVGGSIADMWSLEVRPKASGITMLGPILGPILGPLCGGWMSQGASWRWTVWMPGIVSGALLVIGIPLLPETYAPRVLEYKLRKAKRLQDNEKLYTVLDLKRRPTGIGFLLSEFARPIVYLILDPALLLAAWFYSVCFGVIYLVIVTFSKYAEVFANGYHHSVGIVGTDFLAVGIGMIIGTIVTIKIMDAVFKKSDTPSTTSSKPAYKPESRLLSCIIGTLLTSSGLFIYGFSALRTHFMVPLVGMAIFAIGAVNIMLAIQLYAIDGFKFPASAFASLQVLRCIFAGAFPLFGPELFESLGIDWGVALLAFVVLGLGLPLVVLLYVFGERLRKSGNARFDRFNGTGED
ncbi:MFS general substrate transporter [Polyplosphaeria fusca]|uniref:MFS general substrate transporter n=1 Tax=Polyplosphaeria fusca TaxID=682080 RepID=A0A9P4V2P3_9PLEO|nr:MFS general substrate transporter [Polyplosphaeria fusca]